MSRTNGIYKTVIFPLFFARAERGRHKLQAFVNKVLGKLRGLAQSDAGSYRDNFHCISVGGLN
jgi:hypothetical protein